MEGLSLRTDRQGLEQASLFLPKQKYCSCCIPWLIISWKTRPLPSCVAASAFHRVLKDGLGSRNASTWRKVSLQATGLVRPPAMQPAARALHWEVGFEPCCVVPGGWQLWKPTRNPDQAHICHHCFLNRLAGSCLSTYLFIFKWLTKTLG